jgi:hypothetical protein
VDQLPGELNQAALQIRRREMPGLTQAQNQRDDVVEVPSLVKGLGDQHLERHPLNGPPAYLRGQLSSG